MKKKDRTSKSKEHEVFMNIKTDFGFKKIFGNKRLLMAFLNALSILPEKICDIEYIPAEQFGYSDKQRKATYDVYCRITNGQYFIIEMQIAEQKHFTDRMLYYFGRAIANQAPKGKIEKINEKGEEIEVAWDYKIAGVYMIAILDFTLFKEEKANDIVVENIELIRESAKLPFTDKCRFVTVELPKFKKDLQSLSDILEQWLYVFINIHKLKKCPKEITDKEIRKVFKEAQLNNLTQEDMNAYKQSVLEYDDVFHAVSWAREQALEIGEKRGIEIGRKEGIEIGERRGVEIGERRGVEIGRKEGVEIGEKRGVETGKKLIIEEIIRNSRKHNISIKQIAEMTGLTEEQISVILRNNPA